MIKLGYLFALLVVIATAQKTTPDGFELWTADLLTQVEEALKTDAASNPQHVSVQHLADFPNGIEGGVRRKLVRGNVVRVPPRVPNQILLDGSQGFRYFVIKAKG